MNAKDLIMSIPVKEVAYALVQKMGIKPDDQERATSRLIDFIEGLGSIEPVDSGHLLLGVYHVDEDGERLDVQLYREEELAAEFDCANELSEIVCVDGLPKDEIERLAEIRIFPENYGFELAPWREIMGYEINERNVSDVGAAEFCAGVLFEMTFFGFTEEAVEQERQKLYESIREAEEIRKLPEEEQRKYYIPAEEVFAEFGLPEQTEAEKQEQHRRLCREMLTNNLRTYQTLKKYAYGETSGSQNMY